VVSDRRYQPPSFVVCLVLIPGGIRIPDYDERIDCRCHTRYLQGVDRRQSYVRDRIDKQGEISSRILSLGNRVSRNLIVNVERKNDVKASAS